MKVKVTQSCLTLCNPMDCIVHGILQARILEWVAFPFSRRSSQPRDRTQVSHISGEFFTSWATREAQYVVYLNLILHCKSTICLFFVHLLSRIQLFATPWTSACPASLFLCISWSLPEFMSVASVRLSNYVIFCRLLLLCLQSFLASRSFPVSQLCFNKNILIKKAWGDTVHCLHLLLKGGGTGIGMECYGIAMLFTSLLGCFNKLFTLVKM